MAEAAPQPSPKKPIVLGILIMTVGVGWLLTAQGIGQGINWVWTLGLGVVGILTFVLSGGIDKASIVIGPIFIAGSILSILRQSGQLQSSIEIPVMVILIGLLLIIAQLRQIPVPRWLIVDSQRR